MLNRVDGEAHPVKVRLAILLCGAPVLLAFPQAAGVQWENLGGPGVCAITSIAANGTYVFAGTEFGIFVSADEGVTWTAAGTIGPAALGHAAVHGFLASGPELFAYSNGGVYLSRDHAATWTAVNTGLPDDADVLCLIARESDLFCGLSEGGIYRSTDREGHWRPAGSGLPEDAGISCLAAIGKDIYAGLTHKEGLYRSRDEGTTWAPIDTSFRNEAWVEFLAVSGRRLLVGTPGDGIYILDEDMPGWTRVGEEWGKDGSVDYLAAAGSTVLACVGDKAYLSADGGLTWQDLKPPSGTEELYVQCLAINGPRLFLGTEENGLFRSDDLGLTWITVNAGFPSKAAICELAWMGRDLFAAIPEWGPSELGRIGENSWRYSGRGIVFVKTADRPGWEPAGLVLPTATFLTCLEAVGPNLLAGTETGLFFSDDRGRTWRPVWPENPEPPSVNCITAMDGRVFVGTDEGIFLSMDRGRTWKGVFRGDGEGLDILCFIQSGSVLFAGGDGGVYISRDRGETWRPVGPGFPEYATCTSLTAAGDRLVAGIYPREDKAGPAEYLGDIEVRISVIYPTFAILISADEGRSWKAVNVGLPNDFRIGCLAASGATLIAALEGSYLKLGRHCLGIFISTDEGESWTDEWPGEWRAAPVNSFLIDKSDIYAATEGAGVWKLPLSALKKGPQ